MLTNSLVSTLYLGKWHGKDCRNSVCGEPDVRITTVALFLFIIDNKILLNRGLWARVELRISFQNRAIFHFRSWLWVFRVWNVSTYFADYFLNENVAQSNYITYITTFLKPLDSSFLRDNDDFVFLRLLWHWITLNLRPNFECGVTIFHSILKFENDKKGSLDTKIYSFRLRNYGVSQNIF